MTNRTGAADFPEHRAAPVIDPADDRKQGDLGPQWVCAVWVISPEAAILWSQGEGGPSVCSLPQWPMTGAFHASKIAGRTDLFSHRSADVCCIGIGRAAISCSAGRDGRRCAGPGSSGG